MRPIVIGTALRAALLAAVLASSASGAQTLLGDPAGRGGWPLDPLDQELLSDLAGRSGDVAPEPADQPGVPRQPSQLPLPAAPQPPGEQQAAEAELMGLGKQLSGWQPSGRPAQQSEIDELEQRLRRELGEAAISEEQQPLIEIARQMRMVEERIGQYDSGSTTQGMQQQIVADLERLIIAARRASQQDGPAAGQPQPVAGHTPLSQPNAPQPAGQQPGQSPGTISAPRQGETEPGSSGPETAQLRELAKALWGELPPHAREQMLETFDEAFVPKYRLLIEQYFRRLAQPSGPDQFGP